MCNDTFSQIKDFVRMCVCVTSFWDCGFKTKNMTHAYFIAAVSTLTSEKTRTWISRFCGYYFNPFW